MTKYDMSDNQNSSQRFYLLQRGKVVSSKKNAQPVSLSAEEIKDFTSHLRHVFPLTPGVAPPGGNTDFVAELDDNFVVDGRYEKHPLRSLLGIVADDQFNLWGRAAQLISWMNDHRYCGRCGQKTELAEVEYAMVCSACEVHHYPKIAPCVIVLVWRGEEILLARSPVFAKGMYSTLAGFVEPGESLEETVKREIFEEVAVRVQNIRYFGSQPWPFPGQLMVGFYAEYLAGDLQVDGVEIEDGHWYHIDALPTIPHPGTIAGTLIRHHVATLKKQV